ncbi:MAG TPA: hypothetical protein VFI02_02780 [Armatimonadota bacterium]|nr:hypothetical protein [Armatimonadota bacterium]
MKISILSFICFVLLAGSALAGPNQAELAGYRCIVPDWSKTSGGTSPSLSPDGDTLAYLANGKIWIVSGLNKYQPASKNASGPAAPPQAWQLNVKVPDTAFKPTSVMEDSDEDSFRNLDWSPDGKRLALIFEGRLFVAKNLDPKSQSADTRLLADMVKWSDEGMALAAPRWSRDGSKIAILMGTSDRSMVCDIGVVDPASGEEKVVATDAVPDRIVWEQPWSPDGGSLVYAVMSINDDHRSGEFGGLGIAKLCGESTRILTGRGMTYTPSWSPKGDLIAYSSPYETAGMSGMLPGVQVTDPSGKDPRPIARPEPSKEQISQGMAEMRSRLIKVLKERYPKVYTSEQLRRFAGNDVTESEVMGIILVAEAVTQAPVIGGRFQQTINRVMAALKAKGNSFNLRKDLPFAETSDAIKTLPEEQYDRLQEQFIGSLQQITQPLILLKSKIDDYPTWSPDGKQIAFVRWDPMNGSQQLLVTDTAFGKTRAVFEENAIANLSWSGDGRSLAVQASRNLAYTNSEARSSSPGILGNIWPRFITMPSYSEIWVLDLK